MAPNFRTYALAYCYVAAGLVIGLSVGVASTRSWYSILWVILGAVVALAAVSTARDLLRTETSSPAPTLSSGLDPGLFSACLSIAFLALSFAALRFLDVQWVAVVSWLLAILISTAARKRLRLDDLQNVGPRWHLLRYARARPFWPTKEEAVDPVGCTVQIFAAATLGVIYLGLWLVIELVAPAFVSGCARLWRHALSLGTDRTNGYTTLEQVGGCLVASAVTTGVSWGVTQVLGNHG